MTLDRKSIAPAAPVTHKATAAPPAATSPADVEDLLDEALQLTFPASDPIAVRSSPRSDEPRT